MGCNPPLCLFFTDRGNFILLPISCAGSMVQKSRFAKAVDNNTMQHQNHTIIVGAGIGGLAAAYALARQGQTVQVLEQAAALSEVGAGIQLGPNSVGVLQAWGLQLALDAVAAYPERLQVRDAYSGQELGSLRLGKHFVQRYGARYATVHRADIHGVLWQACQAQEVPVTLNQRITEYQVQDDVVRVGEYQAGVLVGADGLWSQVRQQLLPHEAAPRYSGVLAYRALVPQASLPPTLRSQHVTAWLGRDLHMVQYPVQRGEGMNVVVLVRGERPEDLANWDHAANKALLEQALCGTYTPMRDTVQAIENWRLWPLCDRPPVQSAAQMVAGRVALLGDAAHPMRPFMAQGAGMALEDAAILAHSLRVHGVQPTALQEYAQRRWQRCARVQQRSMRNGEIFHAQGVMRLGRNWSMRLLGEQIMDVPWLYGYTLAKTLAGLPPA